MGYFLELNKKLVVVEVECSFVQILALNLCKGMASHQSLPTNSSRGELEEENVHQVDKDMVTVTQEIKPTNVSMENATTSYVLC